MQRNMYHQPAVPRHHVLTPRSNDKQPLTESKFPTNPKKLKNNNYIHHYTKKINKLNQLNNYNNNNNIHINTNHPSNNMWNLKPSIPKIHFIDINNFTHHHHHHHHHHHENKKIPKMPKITRYDIKNRDQYHSFSKLKKRPFHKRIESLIAINSLKQIKFFFILLIQIMAMIIFLYLLNKFAADFFLRLAVQATVGYGAKIMNSDSYYSYITTNNTLQQCSLLVIDDNHNHHSSYTNNHHHSDNIDHNSLSLIHSRYENILTLSQCTEIRNSTFKIPKIIHQTYESLDNLPEKWMLSPSKWKLFHPDWEYKFWSDDDMNLFMNKYYPKYQINVLSKYKHKISKIDAFKYFVLYHYGGVYADFDISPVKSIEPLIQNHDNVLVETPNLGITNALLASKKNSRLMKSAMDNLEFYQNPWYMKYLPDHLTILGSAGPTFLWSIAMKFMANKENNDEFTGVVDNKYYNKLGDCDSFSKYDETAYFEHTQGESWHLSNSCVFSFYLHCHPVEIVGGILLLSFILYRLGTTYNRKYCKLKTLLFAFTAFIVLYWNINTLNGDDSDDDNDQHNIPINMKKREKTTD